MEDTRPTISRSGISPWNTSSTFRWNCPAGMPKHLCPTSWKGIKRVVFVELRYDRAILLGLFWDNSSGEWRRRSEFYISSRSPTTSNKMHLFSHNLIATCTPLIRKRSCWHMSMYMGPSKSTNALSSDILALWNNPKLPPDRVKIIHETRGVRIKELRL